MCPIYSYIYGIIKKLKVMSNMSYCRFENTSIDLQDCIDAIYEDGLKELSEREMSKAQEMREQCEEYIRLYDEKENDEKE